MINYADLTRKWAIGKEFFVKLTGSRSSITFWAVAMGFQKPPKNLLTISLMLFS
jgi:hypothetical protein